jgi:lysyl-tRNA synthetase class 2
MMEITEQLLEKVATTLHNKTAVPVGDKEINFKAPFKRISIYDAIKEHTGFDVSAMDEAGLREVCKKLNIHTEASMGKGKLIDELFGNTCEDHYIQPTFIIDYPVEMSPLTKKHRSKPGLVERFEAVCNRKEICNSFSELNDPIDQRQRFEEQLELGKRGDEEAMTLDEDFLRALEYGMPPTAGLGIGIDRLAMIMTNSPSIQDVLFFPQMKPEVLGAGFSENEFASAGVRSELIPILQKMGIQSVAQMKEIKPSKLFNDVCGMRKKLKLEITNPTMQEVEGWLK